MFNKKTVSTCLLIGAILFVFALTGCNADRSIEQLPVAAAGQSVAGESIALPTQDGQGTTQPTETPTPVATYASTGTRTPTPTWVPTKTPTTTPQSASTPVSAATAVAAELEPPAPTQNKTEHVVLISIDGLRPDAWDNANTPSLDSLRAVGAYTGNAKAVVPSVTLINHASMLGGMSPDKHGIDWNLADPGKGKINGPTLFSAAHDAGFNTAMVVGKPKLDHLVLPDSVDNYLYAGFTDIQVKNEAVRIIQDGLPDILFVHLPSVDSAGHATGWMSSGQLLTVSLTDSFVGEIVTALESGGYLDNTLIIVTSDHGGSDTSHGSDSPGDTIIPWLAVGPGVPQGSTLSGQIITYDTAATVLYALNVPIPPMWDGRPVQEIFER